MFQSDTYSYTHHRRGDDDRAVRSSDVGHVLENLYKSQKNTEEALKNGQSRDIGNSGYTKHRTNTKPEHNTEN